MQMRMGHHQFHGISLAALAVVLGGFGLGADAPPQVIDAGGLKFEAPATWKSVPPTSSMRRAELRLPPVEGDKEPAELQVFAFAGGAGTVDANVKRWQSQFEDANGNPPPVESKPLKGKNVDVTRVETAGRYFPQVPGQPRQAVRPNYRLLGAIAQTKDTGYFLKLVGPDKTVQAPRPEFDRLIASMSAASP